MSFEYGGTDTADLAGVTATLVAWPSLGGLSVQTAEIPGADGVVYGGQSRSSIPFTFEVDITGATPQQVFDRRDELIKVIDPSRGPRELIVEREVDWLYPDMIASTNVEWERVVWRDGLGLILRGNVEFQGVGVASAREVAPVAHTGEGSITFTPERGNTTSYPTILLPSGGDILVTVDDFEVRLADTPAGFTAALDWDAFRFDLLDTAGNRVESLVPYMSNYDRPKILPGQAVRALAGQTGTVTYEWLGEAHRSASVKRINGVEVARNLLHNTSFEVGLENWRSSSGDDQTVTGERKAELWGGRSTGSLLLHGVMPDGRGRGSVWADVRLDIDPGQWVGIGAYVAVEGADVRHMLHFHHSDGSISYPTTDRTAAEAPGRWVSGAVQSPDNAERVDLRIDFVRTTGIGDLDYWVDDVILVIADAEQDALDQVASYFDGDTADTSEPKPEPMVLYPNYRRI